MKHWPEIAAEIFVLDLRKSFFFSPSTQGNEALEQIA